MRLCLSISWGGSQLGGCGGAGWAPTKGEGTTEPYYEIDMTRQ